MTGGNLLSVLRSLCETDPPEISWQGIVESEKRADLETLVSLGALVNVGNNDGILCLACDEPHSVCVEYAGDGFYRAYCPDAGYQRVEPETLRRFTVDAIWIANAVASALGMSSKVDPNRQPSAAVTWIGRTKFGQYACELFLGLRIADRARFEEVKQAVAGRAGKTPAIVLTTTAPGLVSGERPARCALVPLADVLQLSAGKLSIDENPIYAALRGADRRFNSDGIGFVFSPGFRSAVVGDREYDFTDKQALAVEALYQAWKKGVPKLHQTEIQGAAHTSQRVGQLFSNNSAYGSLIKQSGDGYYALDL